MPAYALTIFLGAFLLFQAQPLMAKYILPWFGGGPGIWTTCVLFFQVLLVGGYAYAHWSSTSLKPRVQAVIHVILLLIAAALLPITPADAWKPHEPGNPTLRILALLSVALGAPYFILSSTGPLLQRWFSRTQPGVPPYRLYALSNTGSLLALVTYPFFVETTLTRKTQASLWGYGFLLYVICSSFCAWKLWKLGPADTASQPADASNLQQEAPPSLSQYLLWLLLPACASVLLLATTNKLCQDVAVIPFLWILPLALYLLSFIICFDNPRWYVRGAWTVALVAAFAGVCWTLSKGTGLSLAKQVIFLSGGLFVCCMVCHGELYRLRPAARGLTAFYLMISVGGALGGIFVAVGAPAIFSDYFELHWGLLFCGVLFLVVCLRDRASTLAPEWMWLSALLPIMIFAWLDFILARLGKQYKALGSSTIVGVRVAMWTFLILLIISWIARGKYKAFRYWRMLACAWLFLGVVGLAGTLWILGRKSDPDIVYTARNFYGALTLYEHKRNIPGDRHLLLQHGRITHGLQFVQRNLAMWPTTYYAPESGLGLAFKALPVAPRRIGIVGLGTGSSTVYGRSGDYLRIYEINPAVNNVAWTRFTYLSNCLGSVEVTMGDARLSLESEPSQHFDLLVLDAFSSDAIPVHLLTREAFEIYERHVNPTGVIAVHISNRYLDLEPVVANIAKQFNYQSATIDYDEDETEWWLYSSTWILLSHNASLINSPGIRNPSNKEKVDASKVRPWTDDFASLFQILKHH